MSNTIQKMARKVQDKLNKEMTFKAKVDILAQMLYKTETSPEEYRQINGKDKPAWLIEGLPTDSHLALTEWQRDDYKAQATLLLQDPDYITEQAKNMGCWL